jgi:hypothetical protein
VQLRQVLQSARSQGLRQLSLPLIAVFTVVITVRRVIGAIRVCPPGFLTSARPTGVPTTSAATAGTRRCRGRRGGERARGDDQQVAFAVAALAAQQPAAPLTGL